jgi:hypothetical protein
MRVFQIKRQNIKNYASIINAKESEEFFIIRNFFMSPTAALTSSSLASHSCTAGDLLSCEFHGSINF